MPRTGPDLPRFAGTRRNASKSRNLWASASLTRPGVSVAALRQPPTRTRARVCGSALRGQQHQQGAADQHQVQPTQQGRSAALPHRTHAVAELEGGEQRLDGPALRIGLDDRHRRHGGVGGQQQALLRPAAAALLQLAPDRMHDDATEEPRAAKNMAQTRRPAAVAGDAMARGRQPRHRLGADPLAIHPWAPAGSRRARRRQPEQGGIAADLADHGVAAPQRRPDQRTAPVPGVEQQTQRTEAAADRPQQPLGQGDLPGVPGAAAQAGRDRHRTRPVAAGRDQAPSVTKAWHSRKAGRFGFLAWSNRTAAPGALAEQRGARVSSITAKRRGPRVSRRTMPHNAATRPSRRKRPRSSIQW